jgi:hypothetical protein
LTYEAELSVVLSAKVANDIAGHYYPLDVFGLLLRGKPLTQLEAEPSNETAG